MPSSDKPRIRQQLLDSRPLRRVHSQAPAYEAPRIAHVPRRRLPPQALSQPPFQGPSPGRANRVKRVSCTRRVSATPVAHPDMTNNCSPSASKYSAVSPHCCKKCAGKGPRSACMPASCPALELGAVFWCSNGSDPVSIRNVWVLVSLFANNALGGLRQHRGPRRRRGTTTGGRESALGRPPDSL